MGLSRRRVKEIAALSQRKYREKLGEYVIEGVRSVESALDAGADIREIIVLPGALESRPDLLPRVDDRLVIVDDSTFDRFSGVEASQGVLAVAAIPERSEERVLASSRILALDGVQDPGNAGTLIRTAAWFGIEAVVAGPGTVDLFNPKTVRSAMGGLFDVAVAEPADLATFLAKAQRVGFTCYGADMKGEDVGRWQPEDPSILVVGNEGGGISDAVHARLDARVTIPGSARRSGAESLNVAQAAGILMYLWTAGPR